MFNTVEKLKHREQGFTLIEMAIVLVVIGLILGMVYKGRQLVASAKVKNSYASYNKVIAGMNTFYDRYGFFPGDGCATANEEDPEECTGNQNGLIGTTADDAANEINSFWSLLIPGTQILTRADKKGGAGEFDIEGDSDASWLYTNGTDLRILCDLDRVADDGISDTGDIQGGSNANQFNGTSGLYDANSEDCWEKTGNARMTLKVLP